MKQEHIGPTASLTVAVLAETQKSRSELTTEDIASAFEAAYSGLMAGIQRVEAENSRKTSEQLTKFGEAVAKGQLRL